MPEVVVEGIAGEGAERMAPEVVESASAASTAVVCAAAIAACLFCSPLTPTATPTMTLMRIRRMRTMIAMPLFVLYQRYLYEGTGEGASTAVGGEGSSLSSRLVDVSVKGFWPWLGG